MKVATRNSDSLTQLQNWYLNECNGDWEHQYGVKIDTLDNPGWSIEIDIRDTYLAQREFEKVSIQNESENDWVICWIKDEKFIGSCGPKNLGKMIGFFLNWAIDS
ncbi:MAG: immunity 53 family protein [Litorimonas sp.]